MIGGNVAFGWLLASALLCGAPRPAVIAHRGGMALKPQNTLPAFENAVRLGVDVLEFDMNVTADDRIAIHHDTTVNTAVCTSPAGGAGPIRTLTLRQLLSFACGSRRTPDWPQQELVPGARIPTLDEVLGRFKASKADFLGETKMEPAGAPHGVEPSRFVELVDRIIRRHGVAERFILQSGDYRTVDEMRRRNPRVRVCLLNARRFKPGYVSIGRRHNADYLMLHRRDVDAAGVRELHAAGFRVYSSTANSPEDWREYSGLGMDGILTDDPQGLIEFLGR